LLFDKTFSTSHVTFTKIINVDRSNKRVYLKKINFANVANVYYIFPWKRDIEKNGTTLFRYSWRQMEARHKTELDGDKWSVASRCSSFSTGSYKAN